MNEVDRQAGGPDSRRKAASVRARSSAYAAATSP